MRHLKLYGIPNCDTVKKAKQWLKQNGIDFEFVNFKKAPPTSKQLETWFDRCGIDAVVNKRGSTWRKLSAEEQSYIEDSERLKSLLRDQPSLIKRPVLDDTTSKTSTIGFHSETYKNLFTS